VAAIADDLPSGQENPPLRLFTRVFADQPEDVASSLAASAADGSLAARLGQPPPNLQLEDGSGGRWLL
jgi:hypothetical protein